MEKREMVCINCPLGCMLTVEKAEDGSVSVTGNTCIRGEQYGRTELTDPRRTLTSSVRIRGIANQVLPVKTASQIPKGKIMECMKALKEAEALPPVKIGDVILKNVAGTGIDIIATKSYQTD